MKRLLYVLLIFLIGGCSRVIDTYRVNIDAVADLKEISPSSYIIKPLSRKDDLKFQRESSKLAKILNQNGYIKAKDEKSAKQIIYFDYGIDKIKEETQIYSEPDVSFGVGWGYPYYSPFWHNDIRYTRYRTYRKTYRLFNRYIVILSKNQNQKELWRVDVSSIGESDDIYKIIPLLLKASTPYLGKNLNNPIEIDVKDDNKTTRL